MNRRDCCAVIMQIIKEIPETDENREFLHALAWNFEDASYKAPEETLQWQRTMETLQKYIPEPKEDWEWEVLSIFTTRSIDELKGIKA